MTVVLGIEPSTKNSGCNGSVFPVRRSDLNLLDLRERNYSRIDVTAQVTWAGKPDHCIVYTYVPRDEAKEKIALARTTGRAMNVRREYVELVESAFRSVNELPLFHATTPKPAHDMPLTAMESVIDADLADEVASARMASYFAEDEPKALEVRDLATVGDETLILRRALDGGNNVGEVEGGARGPARSS